MANIDLVTFLSMLSAVLAIPPSIYLLSVLIKKNGVVPDHEKGLNRILTFLFLGIGTAALVNASISLLALIGLKGTLTGVATIRTLFVNTFFTFISWSLFSIHQDIKRRK